MTNNNFKVGLFVLATLFLLVIMILKVSQGNVLFSGTYTVYLDMNSAVGLTKNTPVQISGVTVGVVDSISLSDSSKARVRLEIEDDYQISKYAEVRIKTTGILGDAYVEIYQVPPYTQLIEDGGVLGGVQNFGDFNQVTNQMSSIADDVKAITTQLKKLMAGDDSSFDRTMKNIERISTALANVTTKNEKNMDAILANLAVLSQNLNYVVAKNMNNVDMTLHNLEEITGTVARGEGTVGKLINDEETVTKLNDALDGINQFIGGTNRLSVDLGLHSEYLAGTGDFKNYVSLYLKPRPDKYFLFQLVSDPDPSFNTSIEENIITSNGTTNTVTTKKRTKRLNGYLFSAQIAKKIRNFTIRGGLIESSGGVGLDYDNGPLGLQFSAFDFKSDEGQRPHLKAMATAHMTKSFYLLGGVDDIINKNQDLAWFVGAGLRFTDDDVKSLLGLLATTAR